LSSWCLGYYFVLLRVETTKYVHPARFQWFTELS
jgi:hypothetical protein